MFSKRGTTASSTRGEMLQVDDGALREAKENLHANRFIVAVCGQMNSGKSTLLNALLFGEEVPAYRRFHHDGESHAHGGE